MRRRVHAFAVPVAASSLLIVMPARPARRRLRLPRRRLPTARDDESTFLTPSRSRSARSHRHQRRRARQNFHHPPRAPRRVQISIDDDRRRLTTARDIPTSTRARTRVKNFVQRARASRVRLTRSRAARWRAHRERSFVTFLLEIFYTRNRGRVDSAPREVLVMMITPLCEGAVRDHVTPRSAPRSAKRRRRRRKSRRRTYRTRRVVRKKWRDRRSTRSRR